MTCWLLSLQKQFSDWVATLVPMMRLPEFSPQKIDLCDHIKWRVITSPLRSPTVSCRGAASSLPQRPVMAAAMHCARGVITGRAQSARVSNASIRALRASFSSRELSPNSAMSRTLMTKSWAACGQRIWRSFRISTVKSTPKGTPSSK